MKRIKNLILYSLTGFLFSCSTGFLDLEPALSLSSNNFYESEEDYLSTLSAVYGGYKHVLANFYLLTEVRSDNTTNQFDQINRGGDILSREQLDEFTMDEMNTSNQYWVQAYNAIYRANALLDLLEKAPAHIFVTAGLKERIEAESKFARAFQYFNLVRFYGDVPLIDKPIEYASEAFAIPRSPVTDIYMLIREDLNFAIRNLPESYKEVNDKGRITKGAALTMLAKVQMTNKEFTGAIETLRQITQLGYSLQPNYEDCFQPENKNNSESIFEVQYSIESAGTNSMIFDWLPRGSDAWEYILHYAGGLIGQWNTLTKDMIRAYEEGDKRKELSVGLGYESLEGEFMEIPYINKWIVYSTTEVRQNACNMPIYRYADVVLMLAEALNEKGYDSGEPFTLLNSIRSRAGLPGLTPSEAPSQQAFRLAVEQERRVELAFEGHRWFDLLRTDRAIEVMKAHGESEKANPSTYRPPMEQYPAQAFQIQPHMLLYPVPYTERIKNPQVLLQNPGY
ncbi:MAG: RagB/SusD family nutrient uptake outer membrane protein [Tannerellaceae bacterium]|nr:RagB/SusD family nutrient uptake outer membrane protein [Tannerellaceae bacterium]